MGCSSCTKQCGSGGCSSGGCSSGSCSSCSKLNSFDWLAGVQDTHLFSIHEIRFKAERKDFYLNSNASDIATGDIVLVESDSGNYDIGQVSLSGELVRLQLKKRKINEEQHTFKKLFRKANEQEIQKWQEAKDKELSTMYRTREIIKELGLVMKLSDVEFQGDKSKAVFYYTADHRVDFRELVKRLAEEFKIRIEMRQIGLRQEAGKLGGIGSCGRELCCSTWLTDFKTVNINAARQQNISLNPTKLSGQCGRLKCCLNFELDTYIEALKFIPQIIQPITTVKGVAKHEKTDIFKRLLWFSIANDNTWYAVPVERVKELLTMQSKGITIESLLENTAANNTAFDKKSTDFVDLVGQSQIDLKSKNKKKRNKKKPKTNEQTNTTKSLETQKNQQNNQNQSHKKTNTKNTTKPIITPKTLPEKE